MVPLPDSDLEQKQKTFCYTRCSFALRVCRLGLETFAYFRKILGFKPQLEFIKENLQLANSLLVLNSGRGNTRQMKTKPEKNWKTSFLTDLAQNLASYMKRAQKMSLSHNVSSKALPSNLKCISPSNKWENYSADSILFLIYKKKKNYPPLQFQLQCCPSDPILFGE